MSSAAWKDIERTVARLVGGERTWSSPEHIDVEVEGYAIEVKNRRGITLAQIEGWIKENAPKAQSRGLKNAVVVKRKAGPGKVTPILAVFQLWPDPLVPDVVVEATEKFIEQYGDALDQLS